MSAPQFNIHELVNQFNDQGYLILKNVLSEEKLRTVTAAVEEVIAQEPDNITHNIYNSVERHKEIADLIDNPDVLPLIVGLLGYNIQMNISHLTVRHPNQQDLATDTASFIDWHQDGGPLPKLANGISPLYYLKICYILSDMSEPNRGNTKVIPGSHKSPNPPVSRDVNEAIDGEIQICGKPGDAFIFGQNIWHAGAPNRSDFTRKQLFMGYSKIYMKPIDRISASDELLKDASPIRRQLLGVVDNPKQFYSQSVTLPLRSLYPDLMKEEKSNYQT